MRAEYEAKNYLIHNFDNIIKLIPSHCEICLNNIKLDNSNTHTGKFISSAPKELFVTDTTELKGHFWTKFNVKYLIVIVDSFSRFAWAYFIESKKAQ
jgi:hypothetical protein